MTSRLRLMGLISGAAGVLALFVPFVPEISPVRAMLIGLSSTADRDLLWIATPSLLAVPIAAWQVRRLVAPLPMRAESILAYILSTISMLPVFIVSIMIIKNAKLDSGQIEDLIQIAALIAYWCAAAGNVILLVRNRRHGVAAGVVAEVYLLLGYLPHALYALIAFSYWGFIGEPSWNWDWGAYIVLAACVLYTTHVLSLLRSCKLPSTPTRPGRLSMGVICHYEKVLTKVFKELA